MPESAGARASVARNRRGTRVDGILFWGGRFSGARGLFVTLRKNRGVRALPRGDEGLTHVIPTRSLSHSNLEWFLWVSNTKLLHLHHA